MKFALRPAVLPGVFVFLTLASLWAAPVQAQAPLGYTGGVYTQNFDGLPTDVTNPTQMLSPGKGPYSFNGTVTGATNLDGWQLTTGGSMPTSNSIRTTEIWRTVLRAGVNSLGTNGSTERALGSTSTSNSIGRFGLVLQNNTTTTFTEFTLSYTGEMWKRGEIA